MQLKVLYNKTRMIKNRLLMVKKKFKNTTKKTQHKTSIKIYYKFQIKTIIFKKVKVN